MQKHILTKIWNDKRLLTGKRNLNWQSKAFKHTMALGFFLALSEVTWYGENGKHSGTECWEPETSYLFPNLWKDELFDEIGKIATWSK